MTKQTPKPDVQYPKEIYVMPDSYEDVVNEGGDASDSILITFSSAEEAEESSSMDPGEAWIAVYELKEMIRVTNKTTAVITDRVKK